MMPNGQCFLASALTLCPHTLVLWPQQIVVSWICPSVVTLGSLFMLWALPGILSHWLSLKFSLCAQQFLISQHLLYKAFMPPVFLLRRKELSPLWHDGDINYNWLVCFTWEPKWLLLVFVSRFGLWTLNWYAAGEANHLGVGLGIWPRHKFMDI